SHALGKGKLEDRGFCRIEPFDGHDFREKVTGRSEMVSSVVIRVEQRHRIVVAGRRGGERPGKCQGVGVYLYTAARLQIAHLLRRKPEGGAFLAVWIKDVAARRLGAEHYDHAA